MLTENAYEEVVYPASDPGRTIKDPLTGDEFTYLKTGRETGGEYALVRAKVAPGGGPLCTTT